MSFNPLEFAKQTEAIVCRNGERKYYRFRPARFYGGIATCDCVGCCLRCVFCWAWNTVMQPEKYGRFYSPKEVAEKLVAIAKAHDFSRMRISGNEPTIGRRHLLQVLEFLPKCLEFILETNGILLGADEKYARELSQFKNIHARVSLKGTNEQEFSRLTGVEPKAFRLQLLALKNLLDADVSTHASAMVSFSSKNNVEALFEKLRGIDESLAASFEPEEVANYGGAFKRLEKAGIKPSSFVEKVVD